MTLCFFPVLVEDSCCWDEKEMETLGDKRGEREEPHTQGSS